VSPLESYRQAAWTPRGGGVFRATSLGVALLVAVPFLLLAPVEGLGNVGRFSQGVVAMLVFLLGLSFLSPFLVVSWVRVLHRFLSCGSRSSRFSWIEARLACDSLRRSPVRSGITVSTLMISLAAIFTIATFVHSVQGSLLSWVDQMVTADLIIHSGARTSGPSNVPLKEEVGEKLRTIPGVRLLDFYRLIRSSYKGQPIVIESFSARASREVRNLPTVEGEADKVLEQMAVGEGIVVSESFWSRFGKGRGNTIHLPTPSGLMRFKIVGVYVDYSSDVGSILIDRALYKDIWHDKLVDAFDLWLAPDADPTAVVQRIKEKYGETYQLFVSTHRELRESVVDIMKQSFNVNYAVEIVAVVVAIFSVINTLLASVLDRTREIGVLRAIGAHQRQIWRMVVAEAGWMGFMGGILGLFAGTIMSYHHVVYNTKVLTGWTFQYHYPLGIALLSLIVPVILCLLAGYFPARQAASTPIVTAIGYE
jgi:putative ABC transport system permease protein